LESFKKKKEAKAELDKRISGAQEKGFQPAERTDRREKIG
jgi:hypothetical protein